MPRKKEPVLKQPLSIAFDATALLVHKTGIGYYTEQLALSLARRYPHEVKLTGYYYNFLNRKHYDLPTLPNLHYRSMFPLMPSKIIFLLRRMGIEFPAEVMLPGKHDFILYPNFLGFPSLKHTPSAPVVHDLTYLDLPEYVSARLRGDLVRFVPKQIERGRFVVTVSETTKQKLCTAYGLDPKRIVVTPIPPGTPNTISTERQQAVLQRLGVTQPFLLFLGTVEPRKNLTNLIDAYRALPKELQAAYPLIIAGRIGWNCDKEIAAFAAAKTRGDNIRHLGYVDDEARSVLHQSAHLFISASHYEGFGMPILEAMNYGTPCALSDIPVFHEVAGSAAAYFDQNNPQSITTVLSDLLTHPEKLKHMRQQGRRRAKSFRWEDVAGTLYEAIVRLAV